MNVEMDTIVVAVAERGPAPTQWNLKTMKRQLNMPTHSTKPMKQVMTILLSRASML